MYVRKVLLCLVFILMYGILAFAQDISWDFEDGNDHGFTLRCQIPATPADDDPDIAGDESITGVGGDDGLPGAGVAWTIGQPDTFDGLIPAVFDVENSDSCHIVGGVLEYGPCNDPFGATAGADPPYDFTNGRGQSGYLGTYHLNQWGDALHADSNDQIATSPRVLLGDGAELTVWAIGNTTASWAGTRIAPKFDEVEGEGYATGSGGIAVLSAEDGSLLDTLLVAAEGIGSENIPDSFMLDLSDLAGEEVIIEVVDAFQGGWGWLVIDEIRITNAEVAGVDSKQPIYALMQNYPNPFSLSTSIEFQIPQEGHVTLSVFNTLGQPVATLIDQLMRRGTHQVTFDASKFPSGIYLYCLKAGGYSQVRKMTLLK